MEFLGEKLPAHPKIRRVTLNVPQMTESVASSYITLVSNLGPGYSIENALFTMISFCEGIILLLLQVVQKREFLSLRRTDVIEESVCRFLPKHGEHRSWV